MNFLQTRNHWKAVNIILALMVSGFSQSLAQKGVEDGSKYGHGEDSIRCRQNLSVYREYFKHESYRDAYRNWQIVYSECPASSKNIYIDGVKMLKEFIDREKNQERISRLIDSLMTVYDQRIKYFGQKGSVLGRKGVDMLRYCRNNLENIEEGYGYLAESIRILKNKSSLPVLATYFTSAITLYKAGVINGEQLLEDYFLVSGYLDEDMKHGKSATLMKVRESLDNNLMACGAANCENLTGFFGPRYEKNKENRDFLSRVTRFLSFAGCKDDPLYEKAAEKLFTKKSSAKSAFDLAILFVKKENFGKAENYLKKAIELETDPGPKADYLFQLAVITSSEKKQYPLAVDYAHQALELKKNQGEPYILIGNAYAASAKECGTNEFEQKAVYWAAVDQFKMAKTVDPSTTERADELIDTYSQYFPDVETIFFYGFEEGDPYKVECWINETTTVRSK